MWVFTSKRHRGSRDSPPFVEFKIGTVTIATITMSKGAKNSKWAFYLETAGESQELHQSFSSALTELHRRLNSPAPEGFET